MDNKYYNTENKIKWWPENNEVGMFLIWVELLSTSCVVSSRYAGELISDAEADKREDDSYLFDLDNEVRINYAN